MAEEGRPGAPPAPKSPSTAKEGASPVPPTPVKREAPPPPPSAPPPPSSSAARRMRSPRSVVSEVVGLNLAVSESSVGDRIMIFGPGGIGKTTLAQYLPAPLFLDLEGSTKKMTVLRDQDQIDDWPTLRGKLALIAKAPPEGVRTVVIDSVTVAEELAKEHVVETRKTEKGHFVDSIEGFGWAKGWQFVYDEFNGLLSDLDRINAHGLNVCLVAHQISSPVPNPEGQDYIRWEPFLYGGTSKGHYSVRDRIFNWCEHVVFLGYDLFVEDGKAKSSGTRTAYTAQLGTHVAKSRTRPTAIQFTLQDPGALWRELGVE